MVWKKRIRAWDFPPEVEKAHADIPDALGLGVFEQRNGVGELMVYFKGNPYTKAAWVVLGKFSQPRDGKQYYVSDRTDGNWAGEGFTVTHHEDLLMAVSYIMDLKEKFLKGEH